MTIRTEVSEEWKEVLSVLTPAERELLIEEADHLANAMKVEAMVRYGVSVRISTNGALELLFAVGCWKNKKSEGSSPTGMLRNQKSECERKGNR